MTIRRLAIAVIGGAGILGLTVSAQAQSVYQPYYYGSPQPYQQVQSMQPASQMESFYYNPSLDPRNAPYRAPTAHDEPPTTEGRIDLTTKSGIDIAMQISDYNYQEQSTSVRLVGPKFGVAFDALGNLGYGVYIGIDGRYAAGNSDYTGSGTSSGNFENIMDARFLIGKDFVYNHYSFSPFSGIGYRHFYSDDRGTTSTGYSGYERTNNLLYLPIGVKPRFRVTEESRITTTLEYDFLLKGLEMSELSEANPGYPDIHNSQTGGYGLRAEIMWEHTDWGIGPFLTYWNISQSNTVCGTGSLYTICGDEPANSTTEVGFQFKYHFF